MTGMTIENLLIRAEVQEQGGELVRFGTATGVEFLWNRHPAVWPRVSPILFPAVGRSHSDQINLQGRRHAMPKHGFARDLPFRLIRASREFCTYQLRADATTKEAYPFAFELRLTYSLDEWTLRVTTDVSNEGSTDMPFCLGAHPAFRWPFFPSVSKDQHRLVFPKEEFAPIRRLDGEGHLLAGGFPTPVRGQVLNLQEPLFDQDALIFDQLNSRSVRYEATGCGALQVDWDGYEHLGIWSKPGADFICIEPWQGLPDSLDPDQDFTHRPGVCVLGPGQRKRFNWSITVLG